jgi:triosephosphate isomerase
MVKALGCGYVLCGHSERREHHGETDADVSAQLSSALKVGLEPFVCIGETEKERADGKEKEVIERQMAGLSFDESVIIAYEPVWAIGKGKSATAAQAQEMHAFIRSLLPKELKEVIRIIYGGSMNAANAKEILSQPDIDGGLVGGASLKPEEFAKIVEIAGGI